MDQDIDFKKEQLALPNLPEHPGSERLLEYRKKITVRKPKLEINVNIKGLPSPKNEQESYETQ